MITETNQHKHKLPSILYTITICAAAIRTIEKQHLTYHYTSIRKPRQAYYYTTSLYACATCWKEIGFRNCVLGAKYGNKTDDNDRQPAEQPQQQNRYALHNMLGP